MSVRQASKRSVAKVSTRPRPKAERPAETRSARANDDFDPVDDGGFAGGEGGGEGDDDEFAVDGDPENRGSLKEDPVLDRRIIEGMLHDRRALLEDLAKEGMGQAAVLRRAAELGLSEALLRQVKGVAADLAGERPGRRAAPSTLGARTCLSCDRVFLSTGPGNRLCMRCRGGDAGLAQF
jgi:hypothetical protein